MTLAKKMAVFDELPPCLRRAVSHFPVYLADRGVVYFSRRMGVERLAQALTECAPTVERTIGHDPNIDVTAWMMVRYWPHSLTGSRVSG